MKKLFLPFIFGLCSVLWSCQPETPAEELVSPNEKLKVRFWLNQNGTATYQAVFNDKVVIDTSFMGFTFKDQKPMKGGLELLEVSRKEENSEWETLWGEQRIIRNNYKEMTLRMREVIDDPRMLNITFRVYDDGFAFRYEFPEQDQKDFIIMSEETQFRMTGDHTCWWVPADYNSYEYLYNESKISEIDAEAFDIKVMGTFIAEKNAAHTPFTLKTNDGLYLSIHEANLTNYSGMTLRTGNKNTLTSSLVPNAKGEKVVIRSPFKSPWRTVQVAEKPGDLITSSLILNLNEPNKLDDTSWIKTGKYMGIWWEMHLGTSTWNAGENHGATTKNAKKYIDFASENGFDALLIEGWNKGWEDWLDPEKKAQAFDFQTPYPDFDLEEVVDYGKDKGVSLIGHHETAGAVSSYEKYLEDAMKLYGKLGVPAVKTGYVGPIIPIGEHHHGQWMVNHYRKVVETAAKNKVMVVAHEPIKDTGIRRTYPNMMAREGVRGSEFNSPWGGGNPPEHLTIVPFTRMLAGPIDYTPGIFKLDEMPTGQDGKTTSVPTTLAYQLAEYVVIYSPWQMASDLPEHYTGKEDAFAFIKEVPVDWEQTKVLDAEIGQYIVVARQEREAENWYVGALTNREARKLTIDLSFLEKGETYEVTIYKDGPGASWKAYREAYEIEKKEVTSADKLELSLAPGGGTAISFKVQ